ncbi:MAG TPA: hypothetical protein DEV93_05725 [Chloroflexi bacterium]|nr:hypothetical protein [Chloroflexota bacterium]
MLSEALADLAALLQRSRAIVDVVGGLLNLHVVALGRRGEVAQGGRRLRRALPSRELAQHEIATSAPTRVAMSCDASPHEARCRYSHRADARSASNWPRSSTA